MSPDLLIFDFDGVLVDSEVLWNDVLVSVLTGLGHPMRLEDGHHRFTGLSGRDVRKVIEADLGRPLDPAFESMVREQAYARLAADLQIVTGADRLLRGLDGPRCIASNSSLRWIDLGLRGVDLHRYFPPEHRFSAEQVVHAKPAPDVFMHAAASMAVDPAGCIVIEDSLHGVAGARAAGMAVIGFAGASHIGAGYEDALRQAGAVAVFDDLTQLPAVLRKL